MYTRLVMAAVCLVSACELSDSERVASACSAICACEAAPLPSLQDRCIAECTQEAAGESIPEECLACVSSNDSCATIETRLRVRMQSTRTGLRRPMMRVGLFATLALAGIAHAQPVPSDPPVTPEPTPAPEPAPNPAPVLPQPPQPPVVRAEPPPPPPEAEPDRPVGFSVGIGVGYRFPTGLTTPNTASVRFRLPNAITFEPSVVLASSSREVDVGMTQTQSASEVGVGVLARLPVMTRKRTALEVLASFAASRVSEDPDDQNPDDKLELSTVAVGYGLAVGFWALRNLNISLSATNSLISYAHQREEMGFGFVSVTNTTSFGLIFDPTVTLMVHLYN